MKKGGVSTLFERFYGGESDPESDAKYRRLQKQPLAMAVISRFEYEDTNNCIHGIWKVGIYTLKSGDLIYADYGEYTRLLPSTECVSGNTFPDNTTLHEKADELGYNIISIQHL